ncbi:branched-chain amino acid ABC transporter permease [Streptomyces melanogenes]|uniref:branched-chain amino acid ABC transporter permease n=1 Tax=Streptomyces melanogenes TaxID=67326 RepID=UPI00198774E8|nr:branched-chain amino acid ABC transporter permease [Streptomyces melanogenes]GGP89838.1 branched-chain amino acid ABC transporter permease [Streptomyces melanogenes]
MSPNSGTDIGTAARAGSAARRVPAVMVLAGLALAPFVLGSYAVGTLSRILVLALLAMSVNLLTGLTGLATLGQSAYFGVGAYTAAIVARKLTDVGVVQLLAAAAVSALVATATGWLAVRARGVVFLMLTLAIGEIVYSAAVNWKSLTNGTDGMSGIPPVVPLPGMPALELDGLVYFYVLAVFLVLFAMVAHLAGTPFALALRGIRDNEDRMRAIGYPTRRYALTVYGGAGALAGAAGALWVSVQRFVSPGDAGFEIAALALLAAVIGGSGRIWGACAGAALVWLTRDYLGNLEVVDGHGKLLLGALFVTAVYTLPRGLTGIRVPRGLRSVAWPSRKRTA